MKNLRRRYNVFKKTTSDIASKKESPISPGPEYRSVRDRCGETPSTTRRAYFDFGNLMDHKFLKFLKKTKRYFRETLRFRFKKPWKRGESEMYRVQAALSRGDREVWETLLAQLPGRKTWEKVENEYEEYEEDDEVNGEEDKNGEEN